MRFLVDECTGKKLANLVEREGYDEDDRILITDDKDFGELVFRLRRPTKGVILLRVGIGPEKRLEVLIKLLNEYNVKEKFIVVKENSVRIRKTRP